MDPLPSLRTTAPAAPRVASSAEVLAVFDRVRAATRALCEPLAIEDYVVQSMPDASPTKWHLAHTTWFFEQFVLRPHVPGYRVFHPRFDYLFNSYYEAVGPRHARPQRGLLSRPTVGQVFAYRQHVEVHLRQLLARSDRAEVAALVELGVQHEQQHQELLLTDVLHLLASNPLEPAYRQPVPAEPEPEPPPAGWRAYPGGLREIGAHGHGFCFDCETPRHGVLLQDFELAERLVTNGEYREFVRDGGYQEPRWWLSDGWNLVREQRWSRPLYWSPELDSTFSLHGRVPLDPLAPVSQLSLFEADAFARWAGARLPTEAEWEVAAAGAPVAGNLLGSGQLRPVRARPARGLMQLYGDVWEWTASPYGPYPGYRPPAGALGEYNGKFMCNQFVLRGGSCATPDGHVRASYRNFFPPHARWQFAGLRLGRDRR